MLSADTMCMYSAFWFLVTGIDQNMHIQQNKKQWNTESLERMQKSNNISIEKKKVRRKRMKKRKEEGGERSFNLLFEIFQGYSK